jgi:hypothetical protein
MSDNINDQGHYASQFRSDPPPTASTADMQAASILLSLSRGESNRTAVDQPQSTSQYGDDQTTTGQFESISPTGEGVFDRTNPGQTNSTGSSPLRPDPMAELVERLRDIALAQHHQPLAEHHPQRPSSGTLGSPCVIGYYRCSEVPEEAGRFIDMWDSRGYTADGILNMLLLNNVIIPHEYLYGRLGYGPSVSESNLRSTLDEDWNTRAGATDTSHPHHDRGDEETEEEGDYDESMQSWEDQLEQWCEWH